jgi:hypothetical protein
MPTGSPAIVVSLSIIFAAVIIITMSIIANPTGGASVSAPLRSIFLPAIILAITD